MEFYRATSNKNGGVVFERDMNNEVIEEMIEKILFELFLYEVKQQYVGKDTPALRSFILAHTTRAITSIKASFIYSITKVRITISPDDISKQMTDYIVLLPDAVDTWLFSLGEEYFRALTPAIQAEMNQNDFVMPQGVRSNLKVDQMKALNEVRSHAIQSNKHGYLNHNAIKEQVESTLASSRFLSGARVNHTVVSLGSTGGFDLFTGNPTMQSLTDDDINTFAYGGFQDKKQDYRNLNYESNNRNNFNGSVQINNYQSLAEQVYVDNSDQRRDRGQGDSGLPPTFIQQFVEKNVKKFPKHPNPTHLVSDFVLGHRGCYLCGDDHIFRDYRRNNDPNTLSK